MNLETNLETLSNADEMMVMVIMSGLPVYAVEDTRDEETLEKTHLKLLFFILLIIKLYIYCIYQYNFHFLL